MEGLITREFSESLSTAAFLRGGFLSFEEPERREPRRKHRKVQRTIQNLLETLDESYRMMRMIRRQDPKWMSFARTVGATVSYVSDDDSAIYDTQELELLDAEGLPPEMLVSVQHMDSKLDMILWAEKAKWFTGAQYIHGYVTYRFSQIWKVNGKPHGGEYYVAVHPVTGDVVAMKANVKCTHSFRAKREHVYYTSKNWRYPTVYGNDKTKNGDDAAKAAVHMFCLMYNVHSSRSAGITVTAKRSGCRMNFVIPQHEWKDFFKNRLDARTATGRRVPIFHWVKAHTRQTSKGPKFIKTHYRGSRDFVWGDYEISIRIPGVHGPGLHSANFITPRNKKDPIWSEEEAIEMDDNLAERIRGGMLQ